MALITYPTKNTGDEFTAAEANEIKSVVNANYNEINDSIEDIVNDALESGPVADALALKAPIASPTFTGTVSGITKSMVGLVNVDNTSDASKPVSTAQATAIAVVQSDVNAHEALTNNPHSVTKTQVGLPNVDNTADTAKPVSTAQQTAIDAKVADAINNGTTTVAPSQNAVFDALALKISTANLVWNEVPTGTINGSNTIYTVAIAPVAALVVSDGRVLSPSSDYTLVGTTLTFGVPPISQVLIFYLK
jgi:hypothetical protein